MVWEDFMAFTRTYLKRLANFQKVEFENNASQDCSAFL